MTSSLRRPSLITLVSTCVWLSVEKTHNYVHGRNYDGEIWEGREGGRGGWGTHKLFQSCQSLE